MDCGGDSPLSPGLLLASCGRLPCETSPDPQLFLRVSNLELFNLQFENEVDPRGQKNKSQTNLSPFFFRRKEMHLGVFFFFFLQRACCHGDSTKPLCNSSTLTPLDPLFSPVIKEEEEMEEVPSPSSPHHLPPIHSPIRPPHLFHRATLSSTQAPAGP